MVRLIKPPEERGYKPRYIVRLDRIPQLSPEEVARLQPVVDTFAFRANDYYLSLIDWDDPADPIRRLIIPDVGELTDQGALDASDESAYTVMRRQGSGLAKRARFVMSHATGKIEVLGLTADHIFFRYHRAADNRDSGKFMIYRRLPDAYWFDDYLNEPGACVGEYPVTEPEDMDWAED